MKLTINTEAFKEMVSKSVKGASCTKGMPLTSMMAIQLADGVLTLLTSDGSNYLYIRKDKVPGDDFYVTVLVDKFSKLISRMTSENITLELKDNTLEVVGNGKYLIELPDDEGELVKYPDPLSELKDPHSVGEISATTIHTILNTVKPALAKTLEEPQYTGYYVGDKVVATDKSKICVINSEIFKVAYLISPVMMELLSCMTEEKINVDEQDGILVFSSPDCVVYGPSMIDEIEDYEIEDINNLLDIKIDSMCKLSKSALLQLLDRLALFVEALDDNAIYLTFTKQGLMIKSKAESGEEIIPYVESNNFQEFACILDIVDFTSQIKSQTADVVEMYYGDDTILKTVDGDIIQAVVELVEGEDMQE